MNHRRYYSYLAQRVISKDSQLQEDIDLHENPELIIGAIEALQDFEIEEYARLNAIKKALQDGKTVTKYQIKGLDARYERLQKEDSYRRRVQWTLDVIKKLQEAQIGNSKRFGIIKDRLEEGITLDEEEISYLKENWKLLWKDRASKHQVMSDLIKGL